MKNILRKKAFVSTILILVIVFILEFIAEKTGINRRLGLTNEFTFWAVIIKSIVGGTIYYFLILYLMKRKLRRQTE